MRDPKGLRPAAAGGYSDQVPGIEDQDLFFRIALRSAVAVVPEALVAYRQVPGSQSRKLARMTASYAAFAARARELSPEIPPPVLNWSRGVFHAYLATKALSEGNWPALMQCLWQAAKADPTSLVRIAGAALTRLGGGPGHKAAPAPSPSPLGPLAARRLAYLARLQAAPVTGALPATA